MDTREAYIATSGSAILYYDDYRIEKGTQTAGDGQEQQENAQVENQQAVVSPTTMLFYHQAIATGKQILSYANSSTRF